ncbi:MAG: DUF1667 domain-containing protein [Rhodobacterales bacterium]|nr:DUF1667 domain-containing protein [Rhodobacterales bacterium]
MAPDDDPHADHLTHYLCIGCPLGCRLEVEEDDHGDVLEVRGFDCKKGKEYGRQEHTEPKRMVTTTVAVRGGLHARVPVKTREAVPKPLVREVCRALGTVELTAPVAIGTLVMGDVLGTGVDIIVTRDMPEGAPTRAAQRG